jgi:zinc-ribbon domain
MFCPHCGKEIQPDASVNFCPNCGKSLSEDLSEIQKQTPDRDLGYSHQVRQSGSLKMSRKGSIVLGIIVGIWTISFLAIIIEYNIRLARVSETASGLGTLVVARVAPSIEISTIVALLFVVITILLFVRPKKSSLIAIIVLSAVNILLTFLVFTQIPQILSDMVYVLLIGMIFNIVVLVYSAIKNTKLK